MVNCHEDEVRQQFLLLLFTGILILHHASSHPLVLLRLVNVVDNLLDNRWVGELYHSIKSAKVLAHYVQSPGVNSALPLVVEPAHLRPRRAGIHTVVMSPS